MKRLIGASVLLCALVLSSGAGCATGTASAPVNGGGDSAMKGSY